MPAIRRNGATRRHQLTELSKFQRFHLEAGQPILHGAGFGTLDEFSDAWEAFGDEIMDEWQGVATRPFGWWLLTHKNERPLLSDCDEYRRMAELDREAERSVHFGYLHTSTWVCPPTCWLQEPQEDYLKRLGLLTNDELNALERLDAEAVKSPGSMRGMYLRVKASGAESRGA